MFKKVIFLNAGHSITSPGTVTQFGKETDFNMAIRDALIPQLVMCGFEVIKVPDELGLKESIAWVNKRIDDINDGLAFSIHNNCCQGEGAETFYYGHHQGSKDVAEKLITAYCLETGFKNRGARSDTLVRFGRLGWIRNTNIWATLIECGFLDNFYDVQKLKDYEKTARGIAKGVCAIYGVPYKNNQSPLGREEIKRQIIKLLNKL